MPYTALPPVSRDARLTQAEVHWTAMVADKPDLHAAISLQRKLIGLVMDLTEAFETSRTPRLSLPPRYLSTKLASGIPALVGEPIQVPVDAVRATLVDLCRALAEGGGGEATLQIRKAMEEGRLDVPALLTLTLHRQQGVLRTVATKAGLGHDLLWLVADLAVSPYAHALLNSLFGAVPEGSPLGAALDGWSRGYCPLCGSWPTLAEADGDRRRLRCSFCAAAWDLPEGSCLYCGDASERFTSIATDPARPRRLVQTCGACRGYAKVIDIDQSLPFPLLALADLDSMDLDMAAMQQGYARPAIKQFRGGR